MAKKVDLVEVGRIYKPKKKSSFKETLEAIAGWAFIIGLIILGLSNL